MTSNQPTRQQRRREHKALLEEGRKAVARGLPNPVPHAALIGVGLLLADALKQNESEGASHAAGLAIRLATSMIDTVAARERPACRKGCNHCCHFAISATAPEVFHIARALKNGGPAAAPIIARVAERHAAASGMTLDALMAQTLPCPMLSDGVCGAYAARPIVCRQFMSHSAEACGSARAGTAIEIPTLRSAINAGVLGRNLLLSAVQARGLDQRCYELTSALHLALTTPNAERRWLQGEDVFASALIVPRPPEATTFVQQLAADLAAIAE